MIFWYIMHGFLMFKGGVIAVWYAGSTDAGTVYVGDDISVGKLKSKSTILLKTCRLVCRNLINIIMKFDTNPVKGVDIFVFDKKEYN